MWVLAVFHSFYCNCTLYKTALSLRRIRDNFETVNGHLRSALCSEKYLKNESLGALHDIKLQVGEAKCSTLPLQLVPYSLSFLHSS